MSKTRTRSSRPAARVARRTDRPSTRERILDAAEELFAKRGYYGVSVRDITEQARVQLALVSYHFGSKEQLYREVIRRRGVEHAAGMQRALDEALATAANGSLEAETVIHAFCASIFERLTNGGPGWQRYIQLLARVAESSQEEQFVRPMNELFDPVLRSYVRALREVFPDMSRGDLYAAFYFLEAGLVYVTANTGGIDRLSGGTVRSGDFEHLLPRLVGFFSAGFRSLAGMGSIRQPLTRGAQGKRARGSRRSPTAGAPRAAVGRSRVRM